MPIKFTRGVKVLLLAVFMSFIVQQTADQFFGTHFFSIFALTPTGFFDHYSWWQLLTYSFLNTDVIPLFFNLFILAQLGPDLERAWGTKRFLVYYFFCAASVAFFYLLFFGIFARSSGHYGALVGPSGAIYGLFAAYGLIFGETMMAFPPMKFKHFILILVVFQLMLSVYTPGGTWAAFAHLTGMASGFVYLWAQTRWLLRQKKRALYTKSAPKSKKRQANHLRLVSSRPGDLDRADSDSDGHPKTWH